MNIYCFHFQLSRSLLHSCVCVKDILKFALKCTFSLWYTQVEKMEKKKTYLNLTGKKVKINFLPVGKKYISIKVQLNPYYYTFCRCLATMCKHFRTMKIKEKFFLNPTFVRHNKINIITRITRTHTNTRACTHIYMYNTLYMYCTIFFPTIWIHSTAAFVIKGSLDEETGSVVLISTLHV